MSDRIAYRFGEFLVEPATSQLWCAGERRQIDPEALRLLSLLVEHEGSAFASAELRSRLWPSAAFVDGERLLDGAATRLRETLNDSLTSPRYFTRLDGGGYKFIHPVRRGMNEPDLGLASAGATMTQGTHPSSTSQPRRMRRFMFVVIAVQLAVFALMILLFYRIAIWVR